MLVYAGIDEAGYGPMLGPLCVGATVFVLSDHDPDAEKRAPNMWSVLNRAVCRRKRDKRSRIAVDDSKRLKGASGGKGHPLVHLERAVLAFAAVAEGATKPPWSDDGAFLEHVGVRIADEPWYDSATELPVAHERDALGISAARLERALAAASVECPMLRCEVIDAASFNRGVSRAGRKSIVNFEAIVRLVDRIWQRWPDEHPRVVVDRQGGRTHYRDELQLAFPDAQIRIVAESEALSRYRMRRGDTEVTVSFAREAEDTHLPVALASMLAKYVRELSMLRMNRFFRRHLPELKPTAGYFEDGRRYLADIDPVIRRLDLPRASLVRSV